MGKRRANQEGSVYQRKDGRWVTQINIGKKPNGSPDYKYFYRKKQKDAVELLKRHRNPLAIKQLNMNGCIS